MWRSRKNPETSDPSRANRRGGLAGALNEIEQKLRCWGNLSHHPDAEHDVAWLLDQLAERGARIAELEGRRQRNKCMVAPP
jgi:hypothetical protein